MGARSRLGQGLVDIENRALAAATARFLEIKFPFSDRFGEPIWVLIWGPSGPRFGRFWGPFWALLGQFLPLLISISNAFSELHLGPRFGSFWVSIWAPLCVPFGSLLVFFVIQLAL